MARILHPHARHRARAEQAAEAVRQSATLIFTGTFRPAGFVAFADHRARRLDLTSRLGQVGPTQVTVTIEGEPDLIDAFEMACSLGPLDCVVRDVQREDHHPDEGHA